MIMKNILIINPWEGNIGPNTFLKNFYLEKSNNINFELTIIYPCPDVISTEMENLGYRIIYNKLIKLNHFNNFFLKILRRLIGESLLCIIYIRLLLKKKYDFALVNSEIYSFSLLFLKLLCPIYVVVHSLSFNKAGVYSKAVFIIQKQFVSKYLAVSNAVKVALNNVNIKNNVYVTHNGVSVPDIEKKSIGDPFKIISVIHPVPHKGAHFIIDIVTDLMKSNIDFEWTILGWFNKSVDKQYENDIIKRINIVDTEKRIKLVGNVNNIQDYYLASDILVHPSLSESFGFAVAEAMSYSLPVLAFNVGALPELIENEKTGILINPFDVLDMSKKIQILYNDQKLLLKYGSASRNKILNEYLLKNTMARVYNVLDIDK